MGFVAESFAAQCQSKRELITVSRICKDSYIVPNTLAQDYITKAQLCVRACKKRFDQILEKEKDK